MDDNKQDKNLQAPQESNTEKHINFREVEEADNRGGTSASSNDDDDSPTKKAWEELRQDNKKEGNE